MARDETLLVHSERIAKHRRVAELIKERHGVLFEGVGEQKHAWHNRLKPLEKLYAPRKRLHAPDDLLHVVQLDAIPPKNIDTILHKLIVVWLMRGGYLKLLQPSFFLQLKPSLSNKRALHI